MSKIASTIVLSGLLFMDTIHSHRVVSNDVVGTQNINVVGDDVDFW